MFKAFLSLLLIFTLISACNRQVSVTDSLKVDISIKINELRSTFDQKGALSFDLFDLYDSQADTIIVVEPYYPVDVFKKTSGIVNIRDVAPILRTIESSDYYCLLFWVSNNSIIAYSLFDRQPIDFAFLSEDGGSLKIFNRDNSMVEGHIKENNTIKYFYVKSKL